MSARQLPVGDSADKVVREGVYGVLSKSIFGARQSSQRSNVKTAEPVEIKEIAGYKSVATVGAGRRSVFDNSG